MKRFVGLTLAFLLLFNLFGCQWLELHGIIPDTSETPLSDKEMLIQQIKRDMNTDEDTVEFDLEPFATIYGGWWRSTKRITISDKDIYIEGNIREDISSVVKKEKITETIDEESFFYSPTEKFDRDQVLELIAKIQNAESCYSLYTTVTSNTIRTAIYLIDGVYYFLEFSSINGEICCVFYADFAGKLTDVGPDVTTEEMFAIIEADVVENKKLNYDVEYKELHDKYKKDSRYNFSSWRPCEYTVELSINYDLATDEEWYFDITGNNYAELNTAMFDQHISRFPNAAFTSTRGVTAKTTIVYSSADDLYADYEAIKALTELDYIESVSICYQYTLPAQYFSGIGVYK